MERVVQGIEAQKRDQAGATLTLLRALIGLLAAALLLVVVATGGYVAYITRLWNRAKSPY